MREKESDCQERDDTSVRGNDSNIQWWCVNTDRKATGEVYEVS